MFDPKRFKPGLARLVAAARLEFDVRIMPLSAVALAEICTILWSVLDELDAAEETQAVLLLAHVLDALSRRQ